MLLRQLYMLPKVMTRQWRRRDEIEKTASRMLRSLIKDVSAANPFYRRKYRPTPDITGIDDLRILPFTTKDELREAFPGNLSSGYEVEKCIHESTSGSSGDVLNVYHDRPAYDYYDVISFRAFRGYNLGLTDKIAYTRFEPIPKEMFEQLGFVRRDYVPVHSPAREQLNLFLKYKPDVISAYPSSLCDVARLIQEENIVFPQIKFIISHSELLTEPMRILLDSVFDCPIYKDYSSFEVHNIANGCTHHSMHIQLDNNVVEIIQDGEPVSPGEQGEIVVTNLSNRAMPFIRYRTGDYGAFDEGMCTCGRGLPLLKVIEGREDEFLILPSGREVSPRIFDPLDLIFHQYVSKFQIIQKEKGKFMIKVVKRKNYDEKVAAMLTEEARKCAPEPIEVDIVDVDDIERTGRGKFRAVINEVKK